MAQAAFEGSSGFLGAEVEQHVRDLDEERGVALQHGGVSEVAREQGFPEPLRRDEDEILAPSDELSGKSPLERGPIDLLRPVPVEFVDRLEAPELGFD